MGVPEFTTNPDVGIVKEPNKENPLDKYIALPPLARWKALILENGVRFDNPRLFNTYPDITLYKVKKRRLKPVAKDLTVYDESKDPSLIPAELVIRHAQNASIVKLGYREDSPISIGIDGNDIVLYDDKSHQVIPLGAELVERYKALDHKMPISVDPDQHTVNDVIDVVGLDRLSVITFDGCWNWNKGTPCRFCDLNPKNTDFDSVKAMTNTLREYGQDIDEWWDNSKNGYLKALKYGFRYLLDHEDIGPHRHLLVMSGNLPKSDKTWDIAQTVVDNLNQVEPVANFDNYLNICPHPDIEHLKRAKEAGINQIQYNLEVVGEDMFRQMCPGKLDYNVFRSRLLEAVEVMGFGHVRSNFVLGLQPVDQLIEGVAALAENGVVADYSIFQPKRGTPLEKHPSPTMDEIVYFTTQLVKIYKYYKFQGIYCNVSSRSSIINECLTT